MILLPYVIVLYHYFLLYYDTALPSGATLLPLFSSQEDLQLHLNPRADSKCQGVYFNPHISMWGAIAPGNAMLGYFAKPKDAALAFSKCVVHDSLK